MTVFVMFFIELMAARFDIFGEADLEANNHDPARELVRRTSTAVHDKYTDEAQKDCECCSYLVCLFHVFQRRSRRSSALAKRVITVFYRIETRHDLSYKTTIKRS